MFGTWFSPKNVAVLLVLIGAVFLLISVFISRDVEKKVSLKMLGKWRLLTLLIFFFLLCYLGYVFVLSQDLDFPLEQLSAVVFFAGSVFVYTVIGLSRTTISQLHSINQHLEEKVVARTEGLSEANEKLERSLQEYEQQSEFIENALNALSHPFYVIDVNTYTVILRNSACGFKEHAVITCHEMTHQCRIPCSGDDHPCPIQEIRSTGKSVVLEHIHFGPEGQPRYVEVHGYPVYNKKGQLVNIIEYSLDITDRKQAELDLLEAKKEAEQANRSKSLFLASMSHEIRTPMNAILGMTKLALDTELTPEQRHCLLTVQDSSELLLSLINDILDFEKIEAGMLDLDEHSFCLLSAIGSVIQLLQPIAEEKKILLRTVFDDTLKEKMVSGDDLRLRQILLNLVGNALKFTEQGWVEVRCQVVATESDWTTVVIEVADTGIGIPPEHLDTIFEKFKQVNASVARNYGGTGLGLAIAKQLVQLMGGSIELKSEVQKGSTFIIKIRFANSKEQIEPTPVNETGYELACPPLKILVVDDVEPNRDLARMILEKKGHRISEAVDGMAAMTMLAKEDFDMVLLDVQMPGIDGIQTIMHIRNAESGVGYDINYDYADLLESLRVHLLGHRLPVIALTAYAGSLDRERCLQAGMDGYISKPFRPDEMMQQIAKVYNDHK